MMRYLLTAAALALLLTSGTAGLTVATDDSDAAGWDRLGLDLGDVGESDDTLPVVCETDDLVACELGERAAASLDYPWRELGYVVVIAEPIDDWHAGRTISNEQRIELFVHADSAVRSVTSTLAHEIGHAIHQRCNDLLDIWAQRRGLPADTPRHVEPPHEYDSAGEDFAEAFAQYLGYGPSRSTVGPTVTQVWLDANEDLFDPDVCEMVE